MKKPLLLLAAATALTLSSASAVIIYQDNFSGTAGTGITTSQPDVRLAYGGASSSATWTANSIIRFNGSDGAALASEGNESRAAYLPFTPQANFLYDYQVSVTFAAEVNATRSLQMGFFGSSNPSVTGALTGSATHGPVIYFRNNGTYAGRAIGSTDLANFSGSIPPTDVDNLHTLRITLDTSQSSWVMRTYFDGVEFGTGHAFATNPTIGAVGFAVNSSNVGGSGASTNAAGTFSDFSLSATPIPEPSHLALLSLCPVLLGFRRKRTAR